MKTHRTPRYVFDRLRELIFQKRNPDAPWLGPQAVRTLEHLLKPENSGLECGAGRSTLWLAKRVHFLESWEEDAGWLDKVAGQMRSRGIENVALKKVDATPENYLQLVADIPENSLDFALVDSENARDVLCLALVSRIKNGGFLMLDNANWFLPSASRAPHSRTLEQGPAHMHWQEFLEAVAGWQVLWTSSGVTDTAFFIRPITGKQPEKPV